MKYLALALIAACGGSPSSELDAQVGCVTDQPPCVSTTGSTCHAAEVAAWSLCGRRETCGELDHCAALQCQVAEMKTICDARGGCSSTDQYPTASWQALDACQLQKESAACASATACPL